jgi:hypothetical protein
VLREQKRLALGLWALVVFLTLILVTVMAWRASNPSETYPVWAVQALTCRFGSSADYCYRQECQNVTRGVVDCQYFRRY